MCYLFDFIAFKLKRCLCIHIYFTGDDDDGDDICISDKRVSKDLEGKKRKSFYKIIRKEPFTTCTSNCH